MSEVQPSYAAVLSIDYPDRPLNRLTSAFRLFTFLPIAVILVLLTSSGVQWDTEDTKRGFEFVGGSLWLPTILMLLFRQKYPRWWFDWNLALNRFGQRVLSYLLLLRDEYPSTDEEQAIHLELDYPDAKKDLNRWLPLVKWFLAIPHIVILIFLLAATIVSVIIAWFAILFTARYPRGLFDFVVGVQRWGLRVYAYAFLLITDRYPPFSTI